MVTRSRQIYSGRYCIYEMECKGVLRLGTFDFVIDLSVYIDEEIRAHHTHTHTKQSSLCSRPLYTSFTSINHQSDHYSS